MRPAVSGLLHRHCLTRSKLAKRHSSGPDAQKARLSSPTKLSILSGPAQSLDSGCLSIQIPTSTLCTTLDYCSLQFPHSQPQEAPQPPAASSEVPAPLPHSLWSSPSAPEVVVLALRPWDLEAEQLFVASLLLFFLLFSDPRPRDRLRLLERLREPT